MKMYVYGLALLGVLCLGGCTPKDAVQDGPSAPLHTGKAITPPPGCVQARKEGGAC